MNRLLYPTLFLICLTAASQSPVNNFTEAPKTKWAFTINQPFLASPIINEQVIYVGGLDSTLYALQVSNGKEFWKFKTAGAIRSSVVIATNQLFLNGGDGNLYCLDTKTGKQRWRFTGEPEKKYDFADYHHSTPILQNNVLYVGLGHSLYAISATDGKKLWQFITGDLVHTTPAIANGSIFFGSFDGQVYSLNVADGSQLWKFKTIGQQFFPKGEVQGSPALFKNLVLIGARDFNVYALNQKTGTGVWNRYLPRGWGLMNTIKDSVLHIGTGDERTLFVLDPRNGRELWKKKMELLVFGSNAYSATLMYVPSTMGKLHAIDQKTGDTRWTITMPGYQKNRLKYFKEDDSYRDDIYSIIKSNEQFLEVQYEMGGLFSTPVITNNEFVVSTTAGVVYCFSR
jgi:eukaryotic-like serine/threonine-protein kinase